MSTEPDPEERLRLRGEGEWFGENTDALNGILGAAAGVFIFIIEPECDK